MAKLFYYYKTGQIILSILCIIFLSAVNELCRTEQVNVKQTIDVRNASPAAAPFPELKASPSNATILDILEDAKSDNGTDLGRFLKIFNKVLNDSKITNDDLEQMNEELDGKVDEEQKSSGKNHVGKNIATALNATPLNTALNATMDEGIDNGNETELLQNLNETFNDLGSDVPSPMNTNVDDNRTNYKPSVNQVNIDADLFLLRFSKNRTLPSPSSQSFINDSRMLQYTTYCISIPFFEGGFYDYLNGKNVSTRTGSYPIYADKLSSRFIPIISLFTFIIYCILRMMCLPAPYSANTGRHRCCCHCSDIVHNCFSMLILSGGLLELLYAHHNWSNIRDWPHIDSMVEFPAFWDFSEVLLLILILSVAIEIGLGDSVYGIIKLDRSQNGYHLPLHQADSTLMSTTSNHNSSIHPLQRQNYFDDAQQEANERELTITEMANLHRCYGSRRSGRSEPLPKSSTFNNQQQFPLPSDGTQESTSSTNTFSNCPCSTYKPSSNVAI